ncbi:MAG: sugar phosphate nucleotidyltransferase [Alphaproteobacteria bacterium]|nr:sugar phosphate nucleotidyltransferase [Alphaproteobacteria bacterium]
MPQTEKTFLLPLTAIILAGGKGTRLAGLYPDLPKPLISVTGQPFLHWVVLWAQRQGIGDFVFSIGHHAEKIEAWLPQMPLLTAKDWKICREGRPLGTGGGVRACLPFCHDAVFVTNGDSLIVTPLRNVIENFLSDKKIDAMIVGKCVPDTSRYASLDIDAESRLIAYREKVPGQGLISAGVYLFRKSLLETFPSEESLSMEYDVIPKLVAEGARILVHQTPEDAPFLDIGTPETVTQADVFVRENFLVCDRCFPE